MKRLAAVGFVVVGSLLAGCSASASVSIGGSTESGPDLAKEVSTALEKQIGASTPPSVDCGTKDIRLSDGKIIHCTLTDKGDGKTKYDVAVTISNVKGEKFHFDAQVASTPMSATSSQG